MLRLLGVSAMLHVAGAATVATLSPPRPRKKNGGSGLVGPMLDTTSGCLTVVSVAGVGAESVAARAEPCSRRRRCR